MTAEHNPRRTQRGTYKFLCVFRGKHVQEEREFSSDEEEFDIRPRQLWPDLGEEDVSETPHTPSTHSDYRNNINNEDAYDISPYDDNNPSPGTLWLLGRGQVTSVPRLEQRNMIQSEQQPCDSTPSSPPPIPSSALKHPQYHEDSDSEASRTTDVEGSPPRDSGYADEPSVDTNRVLDEEDDKENRVHPVNYESENKFSPLADEPEYDGEDEDEADRRDGTRTPPLRRQKGVGFNGGYGSPTKAIPHSPKGALSPSGRRCQPDPTFSEQPHRHGAVEAPLPIDRGYKSETVRTVIPAQNLTDGFAKNEETSDNEYDDNRYRSSTPLSPVFALPIRNPFTAAGFETPDPTLSAAEVQRKEEEAREYRRLESRNKLSYLIRGQKFMMSPTEYEMYTPTATYGPRTLWPKRRTSLPGGDDGAPALTDCSQPQGHEHRKRPMQEQQPQYQHHHHHLHDHQHHRHPSQEHSSSRAQERRRLPFEVLFPLTFPQADGLPPHLSEQAFNTDTPTALGTDLRAPIFETLPPTVYYDESPSPSPSPPSPPQKQQQQQPVTTESKKPFKFTEPFKYPHAIPQVNIGGGFKFGSSNNSISSNNTNTNNNTNNKDNPINNSYHHHHTAAKGHGHGQGAGSSTYGSYEPTSVIHPHHNCLEEGEEESPSLSSPAAARLYEELARARHKPIEILRPEKRKRQDVEREYEEAAAAVLAVAAETEQEGEETLKTLGLDLCTKRKQMDDAEEEAEENHECTSADKEENFDRCWGHRKHVVGVYYWNVRQREDRVLLDNVEDGPISSSQGGTGGGEGDGETVDFGEERVDKILVLRR
ncbi:hypothetical protein EDD11_003321 [Mortierella claussenii]|nr:hypothetical protein EDD11_003321 [Mortierella claussenii]